jgi:hypothetical protein
LLVCRNGNEHVEAAGKSTLITMMYTMPEGKGHGVIGLMFKEFMSLLNGSGKCVYVETLGFKWIINSLQAAGFEAFDNYGLVYQTDIQDINWTPRLWRGFADVD